MSKQIAVKNFDYSIVDKETAGKLIWYAGQVHKLSATHVESGMEMGRILSEAHELCGDKAFREWAPGECGISLRTAYNYVAAWSKFGSCANFAQIELSAMYALTKADPPIVKSAIKLADKGVRVTHAMAQKLIEDASKPSGRGAPEPPRTPPKPDSSRKSNDGGNGRQRGSRAAEKPDYGKCPNCAGTKWNEDEEGVSCAKCNHPWGEPAGDADEDRLKTQRQKTVKTAEALMRAFDDLHCMKARKEHGEAITECKRLLKMAKEWT